MAVLCILLFFLQGLFPIQSLRGSFVPNESGGMRGKCGGLSISLFGPDGLVFGGAISGVMVAASTVTVSNYMFSY